MPTEPEPVTLFQVVQRAAVVVDPDGVDADVTDFLLRYEDADEPVTAVVDVEQRLAEAAGVRDPQPAEIRDPDFSASVRGYDRHAVDAYVERVNRLIAEMQVSGSPKAAVRHALDRVGEQTSSILQRARETAEEITSSAREEA